MADDIRVWDVSPDNLLESPCCGIKDTAHEGHKRKSKWLKTYFSKDVKVKVLLTPDNRQFGYIEYLPGEYAWRGVAASGYMFIHCIWTFYKKYQRKGYGKLLVQAAIDDARKAKMSGVATLTRKGPWLAREDLFLKMGFEVADKAPPDYKLLVKKFNTSVPNPKFKGNWDQTLKKYGKGLTIIRADQCPHVAKFADEIAEMAEKVYRLKPRIIQLKTLRDVQNAPTPYAIFTIIYDGQILADRQVSRSMFENIMKKIIPASG